MFHVLPAESRFAEDGSLGNDFFIRFKGRVYCDQKTMEICGEKVPFDSDEGDTTILTTSPTESGSTTDSSDHDCNSSHVEEKEKEVKVSYQVFRIYKKKGISPRIKYTEPPRIKVPDEIPVTEKSSLREGYRHS